MKIMTILGTRPEIIRLSRVIPRMDRTCRHVLVHTGQNFAPLLKDIFFKELQLRKPDYFLGIREKTLGAQIGKVLIETEKVMLEEKADRLLLLGDTDSSLSAVIGKRLKIPVYHMEAGNRCYDDRVPEEINRRIIDHSSDILMPYTARSRRNIIREGIAGDRIFVTGNPICEVLQHYDESIRASKILEKLRLEPNGYFLVTVHRAENVDHKDRLLNIIAALKRVQQEYHLPVIISTHPRTRLRLEAFGIHPEKGDLHFLKPFGFFDFIHLERHAHCVLTDSGTVQEECCIFGIPNVTLRDVTERPETVECGSNILSGTEPDTIMRCIRAATDGTSEWTVPPEYLRKNVSQTVTKILLGRYPINKF